MAYVQRAEAFMAHPPAGHWDGVFEVSRNKECRGAPVVRPTVWPFLRLVLAHFIADFTFLTNKVAFLEARSAGHVAISSRTRGYVCARVAVSVADLGADALDSVERLGVRGALGPLSLVEDEWRVWSIRETGSPDSTGFFLWDQVVHLTMILALFAHHVGFQGRCLGAAGSLCRALAHFVSVLVFFLENDLWGNHKSWGIKSIAISAERMIEPVSFYSPDRSFCSPSDGSVGWRTCITTIPGTVLGSPCGRKTPLSSPRSLRPRPPLVTLTVLIQ